jgi:hypothetical protein
VVEITVDYIGLMVLGRPEGEPKVLAGAFMLSRSGQRRRARDILGVR